MQAIQKKILYISEIFFMNKNKARILQQTIFQKKS
jgi:hypothetical protein